MTQGSVLTHTHAHTQACLHMGTWWVPCILRACPHCGGCRILCPSRGSLNGMWGGLPGPSCCALRTPWCSLSVEGDHLPHRKTGVWSRHNGQPGPGRTMPHPSVQTHRQTPSPQSRHTDPHPSVQTAPGHLHRKHTFGKASPLTSSLSSPCGP